MELLNCKNTCHSLYRKSRIGRYTPLQSTKAYVPNVLLSISAYLSSSMLLYCINNYTISKLITQQISQRILLNNTTERSFSCEADSYQNKQETSRFRRNSKFNFLLHKNPSSGLRQFNPL
jgi:hypothetical protein